MPHQCIRCNTFYEDGANEILKGCKCGGKLFFFIKQSKIEDSKKAVVKLTKKEKEEVERDIYELLGLDEKETQPVVLDFESIRILKPGQYELDIVNLFKNEPLIFKLSEGKYMIDLPETFKRRGV